MHANFLRLGRPSASKSGSDEVRRTPAPLATRHFFSGPAAATPGDKRAVAVEASATWGNIFQPDSSKPEPAWARGQASARTFSLNPIIARSLLGTTGLISR